MLTVENPFMAGSGSGIQLKVKHEKLIQVISVCTGTVQQDSLKEVFQATCLFSHYLKVQSVDLFLVHF